MYKTDPARSLLFVLLALFPACGGGGGGGGGATPGLAIADATVAAGASHGFLDLYLAGASGGPALVQFEVVTDPAVVSCNTAGSAASADGLRFDGEAMAPGRTRVLVGAPGADAPLRDGALARLRFDVTHPRTTGPASVRIEKLVVCDRDGRAIERLMEPRTVTLQID